jgi:hypothetical protein
VHPARTTPSTNPPRRAIGEALSQAMRVTAPGGGPLWYSGQGGGTTSALTTGPLTVTDPVAVDFSTFVNTESTDLLAFEDSTDGGATWHALPLAVTGQGAPSGTPTSLSGQTVRAWWHVHAEIPQPAGAFQIRWRYTTDPVYEGRGVDLAHLSVTSGQHPVPGSADLTPTGAWQLLADPR